MHEWWEKPKIVSLGVLGPSKYKLAYSIRAAAAAAAPAARPRPLRGRGAIPGMGALRVATSGLRHGYRERAHRLIGAAGARLDADLETDPASGQTSHVVCAIATDGKTRRRRRRTETQPPSHASFAGCPFRRTSSGRAIASSRGPNPKPRRRRRRSGCHPRGGPVSRAGRRR